MARNPLVLKGKNKPGKKVENPFEVKKKGKKVKIEKPLKGQLILQDTDLAAMVQGKSASSYEAMVAWALDKLDVPYTFQKAVGGGRSRRGGQMLDFVVWVKPTVIIDARGGWWHRGDEFEFEQAVRTYYKGARVLVMGDKECVSKEMALSFLRQNGVG